MRVLPLLLAATLWVTLGYFDSAVASRTPPDQSISLIIKYDGGWTDIQYAYVLPGYTQRCDEEVCE